jgi:exosortase
MGPSATSDNAGEKVTGHDEGPATVGATAGAGRERAVIRWVAVAIVTAMLGWSYAPNIRELVRTWWRDPNYSHGFLVVPVALVILYRREEGAGAPAAGGRLSRMLGWAGLVATLAARAVCYERGLLWLETATILPAIAFLVLSFGGWPLLRRAWPAVAFLVFMLPLPSRLTADLALPLQRLATNLSCSLLRLSGLWVLAEGNTIIVDSSRLEVAQACNGLSMLMTMAATIAATTILIPMPMWKRVVLLVSFIPIALLANVVRIAATAWCYHSLGAEMGEKFAHDAAGWLMMPLALALVGVELAWMSWLIIEEEVVAEKGFRPAWLTPEAEGVGGMTVPPGGAGKAPRNPPGPRRRQA